MKAGRYSVPAAQGGHEGGVYAVQITGVGASGKTVTVDTFVLSPDGKQTEVPAAENFIPAKYDVVSTLRVTITREASSRGIDFALD